MLADLMVHAVDVQVSAPTKDIEGGEVRNWNVVQSAVPCRIVPLSVEKRLAFEREGQVVTDLIHFAGRVDVRINNRLVYNDSISGLRAYEVLGGRNADELGRLTIVHCREVVL